MINLENQTQTQTQTPVKNKREFNKNKYLLEHEVQRLEQILKESINIFPRDCLLLLLALKTGARAKEILNLRVPDLNEFDQTIFFRGVKNSNDRELPIPPRLFRRLMKYVRRQQQQQIFDVSYSRFRQIWEHYRPVHKKLHALRHTFAIELYKKTRDLRLVQVALGHHSINNTMIYANYIYSQEELKKLIL